LGLRPAVRQSGAQVPLVVAANQVAFAQKNESERVSYQTPPASIA
jgi:hypothetical protein